MAASPEGMAPSDFIRRMRKTVKGKKTVVILYADKPDAEEIGQSILSGPLGKRPEAAIHFEDFIVKT